MRCEPRDISLTTRDGTPLAIRNYYAAGPQVIILHGIASHMGWYDSLAAALASEGIGAWLMDRRGFGRSGGPRGHVESFVQWLDDVEFLAAHVRKEIPGVPVHALGVSLGGAVALATAILKPAVLDRLVLSAPGLGAASALPAQKRIGILLRAIVARRVLRPMPYGIDNLTDDLRWRQAMQNDPLRAREVTSGLLFEVWKLQRFVKANIQRLSCPVLAMLGGSDKVVSNRVTVAVLKSSSSRHVDIEILVGAPHVIAAAVPHDHTLNRVVPFLHGAQPSAPYAEREIPISRFGTDVAPLPPDL